MIDDIYEAFLPPKPKKVKKAKTVVSEETRELDERLVVSALQEQKAFLSSGALLTYLQVQGYSQSKAQFKRTLAALKKEGRVIGATGFRWMEWKDGHFTTHTGGLNAIRISPR